MAQVANPEIVEPRVEFEMQPGPRGGRRRRLVGVVYDQRGRRVDPLCDYHEAVITQQVCASNAYLQLEVDIADHDDDCWCCFPADEGVAS